MEWLLSRFGKHIVVQPLLLCHDLSWYRDLCPGVLAFEWHM